MAANKTVLDRISRLREDRSLKGFCAETGLAYRTLQKCFQRQQAPDTNSLTKIAAYFRVDLQWLIGGESGTAKLHALIARKCKLFRKRKKYPVETLARRLSLSSALLEAFEKGEVAASMDLVQDLAKALDVPLHEFLRDDDAPTVQIPDLKVFQAASVQGAPPIRGEDYVSIPLTTSAIAAGQPLIQENFVEDYVLLHVRAAGQRKNLVATRVDGVSMEPTLHSGDIVIIDRGDKKIGKNKMYAVFYEEGLTAKYVERDKDRLILRPLNINSQIQVIDLNEHPDPIVGRIIGAWKEF